MDTNQTVQPVRMRGTQSLVETTIQVVAMHNEYAIPCSQASCQNNGTLEKKQIPKYESQ